MLSRELKHQVLAFSQIYQSLYNSQVSLFDQQTDNIKTVSFKINHIDIDVVNVVE